jgi:hypothetical protein
MVGYSSYCDSSHCYPKPTQPVVASKTNLSSSQIERESAMPAARSYRKETADLIKQLDAMLLYGNQSCKTNKRKRKSVENKVRPRSRNVVLKEAADMIWKLQCDEEVYKMYFLDSTATDVFPRFVSSFCGFHSK